MSIRYLYLIDLDLSTFIIQDYMHQWIWRYRCDEEAIYQANLYNIYADEMQQNIWQHINLFYCKFLLVSV